MSIIIDIIASLSITCVGTKDVHVDSIPSVIYGPSIRLDMSSILKYTSRLEYTHVD